MFYPMLPTQARPMEQQRGRGFQSQAIPGSAENPLRIAPFAVTPASIYRGRSQPYHHFALVIDDIDWRNKGLVFLQFGQEKDWEEASRCDGDGEDFVTERVAVQQNRSSRRRLVGDALLEALRGVSGTEEAGMHIEDVKAYLKGYDVYREGDVYSADWIGLIGAE